MNSLEYVYESVDSNEKKNIQAQRIAEDKVAADRDKDGQGGEREVTEIRY